MKQKMRPTDCPTYAGMCPVHKFTHGGEAEELRHGIEKILDRGMAIQRRDLIRLLDAVDARDSTAFLERYVPRARPKRAPVKESIADE